MDLTDHQQSKYHTHPVKTAPHIYTHRETIYISHLRNIFFLCPLVITHVVGTFQPCWNNTKKDNKNMSVS